MKRLMLLVLLGVGLIVTLVSCRESNAPNNGIVDVALSDHVEYWQSLNRPDISSVGTTLQSQHESFIGYVEEITFSGILDNNDGYLLLKINDHDSGESEITSLRFRLTSASHGVAGGGTKSGMVLSELSIGELVVVYFTHTGEAFWVAYPESADYDALNLLK
jgi:hypothetical protein